jgi:Tfp pilus assembly protein PilN
VIEINLLPSGDRRRAPRLRPGAGLALPRMPAFRGDPWMAGIGGALLLVLLTLGFVWYRTGARMTELHASIDSAVADSTRHASTISLLESLRAEQETVTQRMSVIRSIDERRYVWPRILDEISHSVPAYTWLTRVTSAEDPEGGLAPALTIEGNTGSTQALTRFMKNLELSPFVRDVTLVTSEQTAVEGRTFQRFTLEARYEMPDTSMIHTIPVVGAD